MTTLWHRLVGQTAAFFRLPHRQAQALAVLSLLSLALLGLTAVVPAWRQAPPPPSQQLIDSLVRAAQPPPAAPPAATGPKQDLNLATARDLQEVKGIGPVLADRIVSYRHQLGGYVNSRQLAEVQGLRAAVIERLSLQFEVSEGFRPVPVWVNRYSCGELQRHPYFGSLACAALQQFGPLADSLDWWELPLLSDSAKEKMYPYVGIEKASTSGP